MPALVLFVCMFECSVLFHAMSTILWGLHRCRDVPLEALQRGCPGDEATLAPLMLAALLSPSFLRSSGPDTDLNGLLLLPELVRHKRT